MEHSKKVKPAIKLHGTPDKGVHLGTRAMIIIGILATALIGTAFYGIMSRGDEPEKFEGSKVPENLYPAIDEGKEMADRIVREDKERHVKDESSSHSDSRQEVTSDENENPVDRKREELRRYQIEQHLKAMSADSRLEGWDNLVSGEDKKSDNAKEASNDLEKGAASLNEAASRFNASKDRPEILPDTRKASISPYEIKAGSVITGTLITGINSDLPGEIIGQVKEDVYDTASGNYLLIPKGTRLFGLYDNQIVYGQERIQVAWTRLIFPDGSSLNLSGMTGSDKGGYGGFKDRVNNHYAKLISGALLTSALSVGLQLSQPQKQQADVVTTQQLAAASIGQQLTALGMKVSEKNLNIQPTIEIGNGYEFVIKVSKDIVFAAPYKPY